MPLPTEKTKAITDIGKLPIMVFGAPKSGKSTFASGFPDGLFIATEPGLNHLEVFQVPVKTWIEFGVVCSDLEKEDHKFKTVIIDTIDEAYTFCAKYICDKEGIKHASDLGFGKAYAFINAELYRVLWKLSQKYGIVIISHSKEKEVDTRTGKIMRSVPTIPESATKMLCSFVDIIGYVDTESEKDELGTTKRIIRVMRTKPSAFYIAGDRTGRLPETIELSYQAFADAFAPKPTATIPEGEITNVL